MQKLITIFFTVVLFQTSAYSQLIDRVLRKVEDKVVEKTGEAVDKASRKKDKTQKQEEKKAEDDPKTEESNTGEASDRTSDSAPAENKTLSATPLKAYSKFDFVPGDQVIAYEDFSRVGADDDLPPGWNTSASSEIATLNNYPGKWLTLKGGSYSAFTPEFVTQIPENATIQFDMIPTGKSNIMDFQIFNAQKNRREVDWTAYREDGINIDLYGDWIQLESYIPGQSSFSSNTDVSVADFFKAHVNKLIKVSIWRQKERLRVYLNEQKVMDLPRAFNGATTYNTIQFVKGKPDVYISNLRVAIGAPDIRAKLAAGKFVTNGILFDVNSDKIQPESYGILKQIAEALKADAGMNLKITGHTDSDGEASKNLDLSKRRAESVKKALSTEFAIDQSRLNTDGKGATQPVAPNTTTEGKANNRRVEFVQEQ